MAFTPNSLKSTVDLIGTHTATGASTLKQQIGRADAGKAADIGDLRRHIQITGLSSSTIRIQGSLTGTTNDADWSDLTGDITADTLITIDDGVMFVRSKCTVYGSGTITVYSQKFIAQN